MTTKTTFNALVSFVTKEVDGKKEMLVIFDEEYKAQKFLDYVTGYICSAGGYMNAVCIPEENIPVGS